MLMSGIAITAGRGGTGCRARLRSRHPRGARRDHPGRRTAAASSSPPLTARRPTATCATHGRPSASCGLPASSANFGARTAVESRSVSVTTRPLLTGYGGSVFVRSIRRSTAVRRSTRTPRPTATASCLRRIFANEASVAFTYDYFESGTRRRARHMELCRRILSTALRNQVTRAPAVRPSVSRGSAVALPFRDRSLSAVVTDPPYDEMIPYSDASDLFYVWLKRAL